ncbi:hypothetical protein NOJ05_19535 [Neorhizobium galegae]|uniref:hypothetical protein n=1 Tax=Neorhizobium galegae TaxID=399 RepID=UPI002102F29B|nr:hypothetical protein [Neorhizobium galegae]MCQ1779405.1 hypothetical protein [Neorhizobium galegae]MCQ1795565.1 hypothetical protein [Neorhizobium galegae]
MNFMTNDLFEPPAFQIVVSTFSNLRPDLGELERLRRANQVLKDLILLARCAVSKCLITYGDAIVLRGHGLARNGRWLDEAYAFGIAPLGFPDLTMLVVNRATKQPSPEAFAARRTRLSNVLVTDVKAEQLRCIWFDMYEEVLGKLDPIPAQRRLVQYLSPEPAREREIARAVRNAIGRIGLSGVESKKVGRDYPESLSAAELMTLSADLWTIQNGRCALTQKRFELRTNDEGGVQDDRVSLDRINNALGYSSGNVQLVTQFANRARGAMAVDEARRRLVQDAD